MLRNGSVLYEFTWMISLFMDTLQEKQGKHGMKSVLFVGQVAQEFALVPGYAR